ncbi:MAG: metallophosphoesterase [Candidatus Magnetominusculus sp. LBB02]|nr:metallophosphoesterase [Candidatus Magnetominusculus sp. LBB02]
MPDDIITEVDLKDKDKFEFIHISDLHFNRNCANINGISDRYDPRLTKNPLYTTTEKTLSEDLVESLNGNLNTDAVVVSGDLVEEGTGFEHVIKEFKDLGTKWFGDAPNRFVIVPGNHDVLFDENTGSRVRRASEYREAISKFDSKDINQTPVWLNKKFLFDIKLFKCNGFSVLICGFESTYIETSKVRGFGYITPEQMEFIENTIRAYIERENCIKIAVIHHHVVPVSSDVDTDKSNLEMAELVVSLTYDAREFLRWLSKNNFSMLIHGHQHEPFISGTSEFTHTHSQKEIIIAGAGSVSKIMTTGGNYFNHVTLSPANGIEIRTFKANRTDTWGFKEDSACSFPLYNHGASVSNNMANILDQIVDDFKEEILKSSDGVPRTLRVTDYFNKNSLSIALREMLIAFGIVKHVGSEYIITYNGNDEIPISFVKAIARFLSARGDRGFTMFSNWEHAEEQHENLYSPLMILSYFEKKRNLLQKPTTDVRTGKYTLCAMFAYMNDKLSILLRYHESWRVYLIPTYNESKNSDAFQEFKARKCFKAQSVTCPVTEGYVEELNKNCRILNIHRVLNRTPRPSPSRGELTVHHYDMNFYSLTPKCIEATGGMDRCKWFSLDDCMKYKHINLKEPEKSYQYGENGILENNIDLIKFAFKKAKELEKDKHLIIPKQPAKGLK